MNTDKHGKKIFNACLPCEHRTGRQMTQKTQPKGLFAE